MLTPSPVRARPPRAGSGRAPRSSPRRALRTIRPGRSGGLKEKRRLRRSRSSRLRALALDPLDLLEPRLRLSRLRRLVAEALDEVLHAGDLRLLAVDRLAERDLARRLLLAPGVPGAGEEAGPPRFELEDRGAHRLQEPAVVGNEHDRCVEVDEVALQPLERGDVEVVGRLVEEDEVGARGQHPGKRGAGQLATREGRDLALGGGLVEAEPAQHGENAVAPAVAAAVVEALLGGGVGVHVSPSGSPAAIASSRRTSSASVSSISARPEKTYSPSVPTTPAGAAGRGARPGPPSAARGCRQLGESSPASIRSRVDLPAPLRPERVIRSRGSSLNETSPKSSSPPMCISSDVAVAIAIGG